MNTPIKTTYDPKADALYVKVKRGNIGATRLENGYLVDYGRNGEILGFEVLGYSKKIKKELVAVVGGHRFVLPALFAV